MNSLLFENQSFSEKTLKGILLKGIDSRGGSEQVKELNSILQDRVNDFWDQVAVPMRKAGTFDGNRIVWYYDIYKEAMEARRMFAHPFEFVQIDENLIKKLVLFFNEKTLSQYVELGSTFLVNAMNVLLSWHKQDLMTRRYNVMYSSTNPVDWINAAIREEHGEMKNQTSSIVGVTNIINNISLILAKRI